jgi:hypothetical protein
MAMERFNRVEEKCAEMTLTLEDLRVVGLWVAGCAERVLSIFEAVEPRDSRPREAIVGIREFAQGGKRTTRLRVLSLAALTAAREVKNPAARAAARAACQAASAAYTHPLATVDQARHLLGPAVYGALAREAAGGIGAGDEEIDRAVASASPGLREILERFPAQDRGRSRLAIQYFELDARLRQVDERWRVCRLHPKPAV